MVAQCDLGFLELCFLALFCTWVAAVGAQPIGGATAVASSFRLPRTVLRPYDWTYLRVELPPSFSSMFMTFTSDINYNKDSVEHYDKSKIPIICFNHGSPPVPDASDDYINKTYLNFPLNGSFIQSQNLTTTDQCIPFQKNITMTLMSGQISPGVLFIGFFNGLGPVRTQSKMISRGEVHSFSCYVIVKECTISTLLGPYCNQSTDPISCSHSGVFNHARNLLDFYSLNNRGSMTHQLTSTRYSNLKSDLDDIQPKQGGKNSSFSLTVENLITCNNNIQSSCLGYGEFKFYALDILSIVPEFTIMATEFGSNKSSSTDKEDLDGVLLMCYARYDDMPLSSLFDYSADISKASLSVKSPKIGRWYIGIQVLNHTNSTGVVSQNGSQANICFSFRWEVYECINGKAGPNCTWESHILQRVPRKNAHAPFESYFVPIDDNGFFESDDFSLEYFLSNSSIDNVSWTYFLIYIPPGASGTIHVNLVSDSKVNYGLYSRYGGIPTLETWDFYMNSTSSSNNSMFFISEYNDKQIEFYIWYAKEGIWCFGLKHAPYTRDKFETAMSISLEGCPHRCSSNGQCRYKMDESGFASISYCSCDRDHGGINCNYELVSHKGHIWQSVFLIASNGAAILPASRALREKAFAEWVLFTSSGISSALYHACDVGTWCILRFGVLQFMDFWLSFMAVVSTFVFMALIDEVTKRAIHTCVAILTALLAVTGATRSVNIVIVVAIGSLALLIAWILEFSTGNRFFFNMRGFDLNISARWESVKTWLLSFIKTLWKRFRWVYILLGFILLTVAAVSWRLETSKSYWIWHSLWHISIYTSSFFFLCSTSTKGSNEPREPAYELTRQNSSSRMEQNS